MDSQLPGVIRLNVGGTHKFATLRSTLTKVEGSTLARMFSGELTAYTDKDGNYFLDGDGSVFHIILDYLKYDQLPFVDQGLPNAAFTFGANPNIGGFFGNGGGFGHPTVPCNSNDILALYHNAKKFGLKDLAKHLEQMSHVTISKKLQDYRESRTGYSDVIGHILDAIKPEDILMKNEFTLRLVDSHSLDREDQCCQHVCQQPAVLGLRFGAPATRGPVDATIELSFDVDCALLANLCYDLRQRGFTVTGRETNCDFACTRNQRRSGFVLRDQGYCCRQPLLLLNFTLYHTSSPSVSQQPKGFSFGVARQQNEGSGGLFGSPSQQTGSCFGQAAPSGGLFGQAQTASGGLFGQAQQTTAGSFGQSQQSSGSLYGQAKSDSAFGFGSQDQEQQSTGVFGGAKPGTSLFGSSPKPSKETDGFRFGSATSAFGGSSVGFGGSKPENARGQTTLGFGATKQQSAQPSGFGFGEAKTTASSGPVFGGPPSFTSPVKTATTAGAGLFGSMCSSDAQKGADNQAAQKPKFATKSAEKPVGAFSGTGFSFGGSPTNTMSNATGFKLGGLGASQERTSPKPTGFNFGTGKKENSANDSASTDDNDE